MDNIGEPIKMRFCQVTSEYAIVEQYDDLIKIRFKFWDGNQVEDQSNVAVLVFKGVWMTKYNRFGKTRYYPFEAEHDQKSYYLKVANSKWLRDEKQQRSSFDPEWSKFDNRKYEHFVVHNNSFFIEIIASSSELIVESMSVRDRDLWESSRND